MDLAVAQDLSTAQHPGRTHRTLAPDTREMIRLGLEAFLLGCWIAGAYVGIVYWSVQGSLLGVILSAVVPIAAAILTWSLFESPKRSSPNLAHNGGTG